MASFREIINQHKNLYWLLIVALIMQVAFQVQLHLHHDEVTIDDHVIDYHLVTDKHQDGHASDEITHEFTSTPDLLLIKHISSESIYIPIMFLLLFISAVQFRSVVSYSPPQRKLYRYLYYGLAPPSRAPPAI